MVVAVQHILKVSHDGPVQADIVWIVHVISQCIIGVIDIELGIDWRLIGSRKKGASPVRERTMDLEDIGTTTLHGQQIAANRGHCESIIVFPDVGAKAFGPWILTG